MKERSATRVEQQKTELVSQRQPRPLQQGVAPPLWKAVAISRESERENPSKAHRHESKSLPLKGVKRLRRLRISADDLRNPEHG